MDSCEEERFDIECREVVGEGYDVMGVRGKEGLGEGLMV